MRNVSSAFRQMLYNNKRKYNITLDITLSDGTELTVTNDNIMDGGIEIDDAVGDDGNFSALGSTIINGCNVTLYNNTEIYSDYVFINAKVIVKINLVGADPSDEIQFGVFTVDDPSYGESTVTLTLLDNMCQFDRPYTAQSRNIYTASTTLRDIVYDACSKCGVLYDSSMTNFPNHTFIVPDAPKDDCTYREVIGWCATIAGCFATMTSEGKLKFSWFNVSAFNNDTGTDGGVFDSATPYYETGDTVNGGSFNPWNDPSSIDGGVFTTARNMHYITNLSTQNIAVDDVVITGIRVSYDVETDGSNTTATELRGTDDYVIDIKGNDFITADNYTSVLDFLEPILIGLRFRPFNITQPNDPTIEAGDIAYLYDSKGIQYKTLITRTTFNPTALQTVICGAESPEKNSSTRLSTVTKAIVKSQRQLNEEKTIREQLEEDFQQAIANGKGLYFTRVASGTSEIIYGHDKPLLANSKVVLKLSTGGIGMTGDYTGNDSTTSWYGATFDGTWLANIISTMNLFFDYAHGGTLKLGGNNNINGKIEIYDASNNRIGIWDNSGLDVDGSFTLSNGNTYTTIGYALYPTTETGTQYSSGDGEVTLNWVNTALGLILRRGSETATTREFAFLPVEATTGELTTVMYTTGSYIEMLPIFGTTKGDTTTGVVSSLRFMKEGISYNYHRYSSQYDNSTISSYYSNVLKKPAFHLSTGVIRFYTDGLKKAFIEIRAATTRIELQSNSGLAKVRINTSVTEVIGPNGSIRIGNLSSSIPNGIDIQAAGPRIMVSPTLFDVVGGTGSNYSFNCSVSEGSISLGRAYSVSDVGKNYAGFELRPGGTSSSPQACFLYGYGNNLYLNRSQIATASSSSRRYKHDIEDLHNEELDPHNLLKLRVVQFVYNEGHQLQYEDMENAVLPGFIAEEVETVYPSAIIHNKDGEVESWDERRIIPGMLALIQEQQNRIADLESRLEKLEHVIIDLTNDGR